MNRAVVLDGPRRVRVVSREIPVVGPGEALVRVKWAGICGSDVDLRNGDRPLGFARYPVVPGHEWSGVVEVVGDGVDPALLHQPVVGENIRACGECRACRHGRDATCEVAYAESGFTIDGAWADRILVPAALLHVLALDSDLRSAAGIEPAACAATAVIEARVESRQAIAVVGGGTIGMLCTQLISSSAIDVTVVDPQEWKRPVAVQCGASRMVDPETALSRHGEFDTVIEAAGAVGSLQLAVDLVRRGGRIVVCGIAPAQDNIRTVDVVSKCLRIFGVFGATREGWERAVAEFSAGNLNPGVLVTHEFALDQIETALDVVENGGPMVGKVLLRP